ncbi:hypothetical protein PsorP6_008005 [Peronosclerospora sorghi]|uniref:Uncharacterized protein n=1 Tax=Peronosclerospora sorghi TaxID=230839 RepID=A0ACC0WAL8_9STRA|nr:hypothetical protein PsorP6_008005 [Peronosclerospora sorghi]
MKFFVFHQLIRQASAKINLITSFFIISQLNPAVLKLSPGVERNALMLPQRSPRRFVQFYSHEPRLYQLTQHVHRLGPHLRRRSVRTTHRLVSRSLVPPKRRKTHEHVHNCRRLRLSRHMGIHFCQQRERMPCEKHGRTRAVRLTHVRHDLRDPLFMQRRMGLEIRARFIRIDHARLENVETRFPPLCLRHMSLN